jgi:hypothetical protein
MAVTLFFHDGQIAEFPSATTAEKCDGLIHVLHFNPQTLALERVEVFEASDVALTEVFVHGDLRKVIIPHGAVQADPRTTRH